MFLKTRHTIIAIAAVAAAAVIGFVGAAARMTANNTGDFAGDGYILTLDTSQSEEVIVKNEYRFHSGAAWELEKNGQISFQTADGGMIQVGSDRFVHYEDGSVSVLTDAVAANLDGYPDGVINYYNMTPGQALTADDGHYVYEDALQEYEAENLLLKNGFGHYLVLSPAMELVFGDGESEKVEDGYLELIYPNEENIAVQLTDGVRAWQVLREGLTITLANGVVLSLADEEIRVPDASSASGASTSVGFDELLITRSSGLLNGRQGGTNVAEKLAAPVFNFFLQDGEDGEDGQEGLGGADGQSGETGMNGEAGADGSDGSDGGNGKTGASGPGGTSGADAQNGEDSTETIILGTPRAVIGGWKLTGTELSFDVSYEAQTLEYITRESEAWSVSIYEVGGDASPLESWTSGSGGYGDFLLIPSQSDVAQGTSAALVFHTDKLQPDKEYRIVVRDTYKLNDNKSEFGAYDMAERTFTTDTSGVRLDLLNSSEDGLHVSLSADGGSVQPGSAVITCTSSSSDPASGKYVSMTAQIDGQSVTYDWSEIRINSDGSRTIRYYKFENGAGTPVHEVTVPSPGADISYGEALEDIEIPGIPSGTEVKLSANVEVETDGGTSFEKTIEAVFETRKRAPVIGGVTLQEYEGGFLRAEVHGLYDETRNSYGEIEDEDGVLKSITYDLYDENGFKAGYRMEAGAFTGFTPSKKYPAVASRTVTVSKGQTAADFVVDNGKLKSNIWYYAVASYTYTDGTAEWTVPVLESRSDWEDGDYQHKKSKDSWSRAILDEENLVTMSFNAAGSGIYNNEKDQNEGVTYHSITGLMSVKLGGQKLMVSDLYPMKLTVTGTPCYENTITYTACNGSQGVYGGNFDLSVALDGLLEKHAYTFTLNAYLYNATTGEYEYQTVATNVVSTGAADGMEVGMIRSSSGTGVEFVLGGTEYTEAASPDRLPVYKQNTEEYRRKIPSSYRNASTILFSLYPKLGVSEIPEGDAIGVAYVTLNKEDEASAAEYGKLYDYYYGSNVLDPDKAREYENTVGIGPDFEFQFVYTAHGASAVTQNHKSAGDLMDMADLEDYGYSYNTFLIDARVGYDYTSERYVYSKNLADKEKEDGVTEEQLQEYKSQELYPYYKDWAQEGLFKTDYTNTLAVTSNICLVNSSNRPTNPLVYQPDLSNPAITLTELDNSYGMNSADTDITAFNLGISQDVFNPDDAYDEVSSMGFRLTTRYNIEYTKSLTYYGFTYDDFYKEDGNHSLDVFKDQALLKFTIDDYGTIEKDTITCNYVKDVNGTKTVVTPEVWMLFYDSSDTESKLTQAITTEAGKQDGLLKPVKAGDKGYSYYYQPKRDDNKSCYTDEKTGTDIFVLYVDVAESQTEVIRRGNAYIFAMDSMLHYWDSAESTYNFPYPSKYYEKGWVLGDSGVRPYNKDAALQSNGEAVIRTMPECESTFVSALDEKETQADGTEKTVIKETWKLRLKDKDHAVYPESLANMPTADLELKRPGGLLLWKGDKDISTLPKNTAYLRVYLDDSKIITIHTSEKDTASQGSIDYNANDFTDAGAALQALYEALTGEKGVRAELYNQYPEQERRYQWAFVYDLCESIQFSHTEAGQKQFPLLDHSYKGNSVFEDNFRIETGEMSDDNPYGIRMGADNDTITVSILKKDDADAFSEEAFENVAAVAVTAYNHSGYTYGDNKTGKWIYRFSADGKRVGSGNMTDWITEFEDITENGTVIGKKFTYRASDFSSSGVETYKQGDRVSYIYRAYCTDGTSWRPERAAELNKNRNLSMDYLQDGIPEGEHFISYFTLKELSADVYTEARTVPGADEEELYAGAGTGVVKSWQADTDKKTAQFDYFSLNKNRSNSYTESHRRGKDSVYAGHELMNLAVKGSTISLGQDKTEANGSYELFVPRQRMALMDFQVSPGLSKASAYLQVANYSGIAADSRIIYLLYEFNEGTVPYKYLSLDFSGDSYGKITPEMITEGAMPNYNTVYLKEKGSSYVRCTGLKAFEAGATYHEGVMEKEAYRTEEKPVPGMNYYIRKEQEGVITYEQADMSGVEDFSFRSQASRYVGAMVGGVGELSKDGEDYFQLTGLSPRRSYYVVPYCLEDSVLDETAPGYDTTFADTLKKNSIAIDQIKNNHLYRVSSQEEKGTAEAVKRMVESAYSQVELKPGIRYGGGMYFEKQGDSYVLKEELFTAETGKEYYVRSFFRFDSNRSVDMSAKSQGTKLQGYDWTIDFTSQFRKGLDIVQTVSYSWNAERGYWSSERNPLELAGRIKTKDGADARMTLNGEMFVKEDGSNILNGLNHANMKFNIYANNITVEDENTRLYWFLQRQSLGENGDWELLIGDEHCPAVKDGKIEQLLKAEKHTEYRAWSYYGKDQDFCTGENHGATVKASHKLKFYPEDPLLQPGYRYRLTLLVLQEEDGGYTVLNVQESDGSLNCQSNEREWRAYAGEPLVSAGTQLDGYTSQDIYYSTRIDNQSGMLVDNGYYIRLCKEVTDGQGQVSYEAIEDDSCYQSYTIHYGKYEQTETRPRIVKNRLYPAGRTITWHFRIPDDNKGEADTYRIQYYAYVDKDFDNLHELAGGSDGAGNLILAGDQKAPEEENGTRNYEFVTYAPIKGSDVTQEMEVYDRTESEYQEAAGLAFKDVILPGVYYEDVYEKAEGTEEPLYVRELRETLDTEVLPGKTYYKDTGYQWTQEELDSLTDMKDCYVYVYREATEAEKADQEITKYTRTRELIFSEGRLYSEDTPLYTREPDKYTLHEGQCEPGKTYYRRNAYYPTPQESYQVTINTMRPLGGASFGDIYAQKLAREAGILTVDGGSSYDMSLNTKGASALLIGHSEDITLPENEDFRLGSLINYQKNADSSVTFTFKDAYSIENADYAEWQITYRGGTTPLERIDRNEPQDDGTPGTVMDNNGRQGTVSLTLKNSGISWEKEKYVLSLYFYKNPEQPDGKPQQLFTGSWNFEF